MSLDPLRKKVRKAVRLALNEMGRRMVAYIRWKIGVWVVYHDGWIERSDPGEPPRREFSVLWKSIKYKRNPGGETWADVSVYVSEAEFTKAGKDVYAWYLEYGTSGIEPRPFWHSSLSELRPHMKEWFGRTFYEKLGQLSAQDEFDSSDEAADFPASDGAMPE